MDYPKYVRVNEKFIRPNEPPNFGDSTKARRFWLKPSLNFTELIHEMCEAISQQYLCNS